MGRQPTPEELREVARLTAEHKLAKARYELLQAELFVDHGTLEIHLKTLAERERQSIIKANAAARAAYHDFEIYATTLRVNCEVFPEAQLLGRRWILPGDTKQSPFLDVEEASNDG
jgi:hypothetical protein